jgi:hypothetical protein
MMPCYFQDSQYYDAAIISPEGLAGMLRQRYVESFLPGFPLYAARALRPRTLLRRHYCRQLTSPLFHIRYSARDRDIVASHYAATPHTPIRHAFIRIHYRAAAIPHRDIEGIRYCEPENTFMNTTLLHATKMSYCVTVTHADSRHYLSHNICQYH